MSAEIPRATTTAIEEWCLKALEEQSQVLTTPDGPLSELTVVVPTRDRQDFILRQIRYWSREAVNLLIVDGSVAPLPGSIRSAIEGHPRITYRHESLSFSGRLCLAGHGLSTAYAVMLGDDEFHLPSGLTAAIRILEEDQELVGCMGQVLSFSPMDNYRRCLFARAYRSMHGFSACQSRPDERLHTALSPYTMASCYAVLRSSVWRRSWGSVGEYRAGVAAEMQQAMAVHLLGPFVTVDQVQWLRSIENAISPISEEETKRGRMIWFPEWWEGPEYELERLEFVSRLSDSVEGVVEAGPEECSEWIVSAARKFVEENRSDFVFEDRSQGTLWNVVSKFARLLRRMGSSLPDSAVLAIRRIYGRLQHVLGLQGGNYYGVTEDLPTRFREDGLDPASGCFGEIEVIEEVVRDFHRLRTG